MSAAHAKSHLADLVSGVAYGGEQYIIERRGKPVAVLVGVDDLNRRAEQQPSSDRPKGFLSLVGAWGDLMSDEEIDDMVRHICAARERDTGRPVDLPD